MPLMIELYPLPPTLIPSHPPLNRATRTKNNGCDKMHFAKTTTERKGGPLASRSGGEFLLGYRRSVGSSSQRSTFAHFQKRTRTTPEEGMTDGVTFRACFRALTQLALKVLPAADADRARHHSGGGPRGEGPPADRLARRGRRGETRRMHKSRVRARAGRKRRKGGIFVEKGLPESFTSDGPREGDSGGEGEEGRHAATASSGNPARPSPAPIMHFWIRRFAGSTTFRSPIDATSEEFDVDKRAAK